MGVKQRACIAFVLCALTAILAGYDSQAAARVDPAEWGTGIVLHKEPGSRLVGGRRVSTPQALAAGQWDSPEQMYQATCGGCHGTGVGPHLLGQALPDAYIRYVGRNGLRAMPPFRVTDYTDGELATLAAWINEQPAVAGAPVPVPPVRAQVPEPVASGSGGEAMYAMCSGCHDNGAPPLRGRAFLQGYFEAVVRNGVRRMPAFSQATISDSDLTALGGWLNTLQRRGQ
jgi:mono/diheme cytochrome c family protein